MQLTVIWLALKMLDVFRCCFIERELKQEAEALILKQKLTLGLRFSEAIWVLLNSDCLSDSTL